MSAHQPVVPSAPASAEGAAKQACSDKRKTFVDAVDNAVRGLNGRSGSITMPSGWLDSFRRVAGFGEATNVVFTRGKQRIRFLADRRLKGQLVTLADVELRGTP